MDVSASFSSDEEETTDPSIQPKEEELVTKLQLRLSASHLPRTGRMKISRRSPDTFATVVSIVRKNGAPNRSSQDHLNASFSFDSTRSEDDYMAERGSTEV